MNWNDVCMNVFCCKEKKKWTQLLYCEYGTSEIAYAKRLFREIEILALTLAWLPASGLYLGPIEDLPLNEALGWVVFVWVGGWVRGRRWSPFLGVDKLTHC